MESTYIHAHAQTPNELYSTTHRVTMVAGRSASRRRGLASQQGDMATLRRCVQRGVDVNASVYVAASGHLGGSCTAVYVATEHGHEEVVDYLVSKGQADVNKGDTNDRWSPLHRACDQANEHMVSVLLRLGANVQTHHQQTPLMIAARKGTVDILQLLLQHEGMVVSVRNDDGYTALDIARHNGCDACAQAILEYRPRLTPTMVRRRNLSRLRALSQKKRPIRTF